MPKAWLLPIAVIRLHVGDLHAVGWVRSMIIGDPRDDAITRVGVRLKNILPCLTSLNLTKNSTTF